MAIRRRLVAGLVAAFGVAAVLAEGEAPAQDPVPGFPFDVELVKPLGFRTKPDLDAPAVLGRLMYLQPPARLHVVSATGPLWTAGTFCSVEYAGRQGFLRCDDRALMKPLAATGIAPSTSGGSVQPAGAPKYKQRNAFGVSCGNMESCTEFCKQACDVLPSGGAHCPRVPGGEGLIPESSSLLRPLPTDLRYVRVDRGDKATPEVIEGLRRLDAWLATSRERAEKNYKLHVSNCWRDGITDSQKECYFIMKGIDPQAQLKLAMPGATPHSSGKACDIHLVDSAGHNAVPSNACTADAKTGSSIDFKNASRMLDEALTNDSVGAQRLNYEAWHYEWGGAVKDGDCRCKAPECQEKFWPPTCTPRGCKAH